MKLYRFILVAGLLAFFTVHATLGDQRPNIIFILVDDMGYSDIGCYGGEINTPNLDHLAERGLRFSQMHNTSKCYPSRACLLTGVYAQQCGMQNGFNGIRDAVTLGDVLRSAGYRTLAAGKHHSHQSLHEVGFDRWFGLRDGANNHFNPGNPRPGEPKPAQKKPGKRVWCIDDQTFTPYTPPEKDFYSTDYFTKYAISYLEEYKNEEKPFFLYLAYTAPHDPLQAWPRDIAKYRGKYSAGYEAIRTARYEKMVELGIADPAMKLSGPTFSIWNSLSNEERKREEERMEVYAAMIDCVDQNIGRLLVQLEELGELDNTLILFAADNGSSAEFAEKGVGGTGAIGSMSYWASLGKNWANVSNTPFRLYKNDSYEGGICTPFIAYWPGKIKNHGSIDHRPLHFIDVMPTLAELADATYPSEFRDQKITPMQGESFLPALLGAEATDREKPIFWQWQAGKAVRRGKWKAVAKGSEWSLFNMENDRNETTDLKAQFPETFEELRGLYDAWSTSVGVKPAKKQKKSKQQKKDKK
jgi:arylsulfatase A-like enzyme